VTECRTSNKSPFQRSRTTARTQNSESSSPSPRNEGTKARRRDPSSSRSRSRFEITRTSRIIRDRADEILSRLRYRGKGGPSKFRIRGSRRILPESESGRKNSALRSNSRTSLVGNNVAGNELPVSPTCRSDRFPRTEHVTAGSAR